MFKCKESTALAPGWFPWALWDVNRWYSLCRAAFKLKQLVWLLRCNYVVSFYLLYTTSRQTKARRIAWRHTTCFIIHHSISANDFIFCFRTALRSWKLCTEINQAWRLSFVLLTRITLVSELIFRDRTFYAPCSTFCYAKSSGEIAKRAAYVTPSGLESRCLGLFGLPTQWVLETLGSSLDTALARSGLS